jgi:hypothetical protein
VGMNFVGSALVTTEITQVKQDPLYVDLGKMFRDLDAQKTTKMCLRQNLSSNA